MKHSPCAYPLPALAAAAMGAAAVEPTRAADPPAHDRPLVMRQVELGGSLLAEVRRLQADEEASAHRQLDALTRAAGDVVPVAAAPRIGRVNGKGFDQVSFTPGASYLVQGAGFGVARGRVRIAGAFPAGALPIVIERWRDDAVVLRVPSALGGLADQEGLTLQLHTAGGRQATVSGARFVAARETVTFTLGPKMRATWGPPLPRLNDTPGARVHVQRHVGQHVPSPNDAFGQPGLGSVPGCFSAGTDEFDFSDLAPGFKLTGYVWGYEQPPESTVTLAEGPLGQDIERRIVHGGTYSVDLRATSVRMHWAATLWQYVRRFGAFTYRCDAKYAIGFRLEGPRGMKPFGGAAPVRPDLALSRPDR